VFCILWSPFWQGSTLKSTLSSHFGKSYSPSSPRSQPTLWTLNAFWVNVQNNYASFVTNVQGGSPKSNLIRVAFPGLFDESYNEPQIIRNICVMDLFCDTNPCALKNTNTIKPQKQMSFWTICFHSKFIISASIITLLRLSLLKLITTISKKIEWESLPSSPPHSNGQVSMIGCQIWKLHHN
jgi:hypothetical protein